MRWSTLLAAALLPAAALARFVAKRDDVTTTDQYLFSITLGQFIADRNARNPPTLDWSSDGCTSAPDNPLGFDFQQPCYRHDFGYRNYRKQNRFNKTTKPTIDSNFLADMKYECKSETLGSLCRGFADVYYAAVVAFGDSDVGKRITHEEAVQDYEAKLAAYNAMVAEAIQDGTLDANGHRKADKTVRLSVSVFNGALERLAMKF